MNSVGNQGQQAGFQPAQSSGAAQNDKKNLVDWPWPVIASVVGLLLLGIAYSSGDAYYNSYLRWFGVEGSAFPIDKSRHLILAVWAALNGSVGAGHWLGSHKLYVFGLFLGSLAYLAVLIFLKWGWDKASIKYKWASSPKSPIVKRRPYIGKFLIAVFWVWFPVLSIVYFGIFVPAILAIPSGIGESVGKEIAVEDKRDFDKGCEKSSARCQVMLKDGKEVARGYVIAQSTSRVALYLNSNVRQLSLDGTELRTFERPEPSGRPQT